MASSDDHRSGLLTAGGVLSIVGGVPQIICGGVLIVDYFGSWPHGWMLIEPLFLPFFPSIWRYYIMWGMFPSVNSVPAIGWAIIAACIGIVGIIAAIGGVSTIRRNRFGLSLAGAICVIPSGIMGILAVIFVVLGKREFGTRRNENGI